jgi:hypothetical protein
MEALGLSCSSLYAMAVPAMPGLIMAYVVLDGGVGVVRWSAIS